MSGCISNRPLLVLLLLISAAALFSEEKKPIAITFTQAAELAVAYSIELNNESRTQKLLEKAWIMGVRSYFPRMTVAAQENDRLQETGSDSFLKNYSINMDQLLWDGGRLRMSRKLDKTELNLSKTRLERMSGEVGETAIAAYRSVLSTRAILAIRETAFETLSGQLKILAKETELGLALPIDYSEAEIALAEARIEIITLESDLAEMEQQFADFLGLETLPLLTEKIDINRSSVLPPVNASVVLAREKNPGLAEARFSIARKQTELKYASRSWIPSLRLNGNFGLSGRYYPLSRYTWSVGLNVEFSNPWLQNTFAVQTGLESPRDINASMQNTASPLPDPASSLGRKQAKLALAIEKEKYDQAFEQTGRNVMRVHERCRLADRKRLIALDAIDMAEKRFRLEEIRLGLGQITRLDLMKAQITYTEKEIAAVEAAMGMLKAEREFEQLLDLKPGELSDFAGKNIFSGVNE